MIRPRLPTIFVGLLACLLLCNISQALQDWEFPDWYLVLSSNGSEKRSAPIRTVVQATNGRLLGTRPAGSTIELWGSDNNGIDWTRMTNIAQSETVIYGDSTLSVLPSGEILAGFRELHPSLGWSVRVSRSLDNGQSWNFGGTIHDWTLSQNEFVGAPFFNQLSNHTLQAYYDSEVAAPGGNQYIALKDGVFNSTSGLWEWSNERIVNTTGVGAAGVRDGLATVVNLGPDLDGMGDRLMVVTEGIGITGGQAHNLVRAFEVENGGAAQTDWNNLLDSRVVYRSLLLDPQGHRYNAYAPFALRLSNGSVLVAFSTDEGLYDIGEAADVASTPPHLRHSEIKFVHTTTDFETWSAPTTLWGPDHPEFVGSQVSGDIFNYQIGLFELSANDVLATLDLFGGRQIVFRPSLGGLSADFDENGSVDGRDLLLWQRGFGLINQNTTTTGDATGEGTVNSADLDKWSQQYGMTSAAMTATLTVPEPRCLGQFLTAIVFAWGRKGVGNL